MQLTYDNRQAYASIADIDTASLTANLEVNTFQLTYPTPFHNLTSSIVILGINGIDMDYP